MRSCVKNFDEKGHFQAPQPEAKREEDRTPFASQKSGVGEHSEQEGKLKEEKRERD